MKRGAASRERRCRSLVLATQIPTEIYPLGNLSSERWIDLFRGMRKSLAPGRRVERRSTVRRGPMKVTVARYGSGPHVARTLSDIRKRALVHTAHFLFLCLEFGEDPVPFGIVAALAA